MNSANARQPRRGKSHFDSPKSKKTRSKLPDHPFEFGAILGDNELTLTLDLETRGPNLSEPWRKRHKRHKKQERAIMFSMIPYRQIIKLPCTITCIRYASKELDSHDSLPMSFKKIVDAVTAEITGDFRPGRADGNGGFTFCYDQKKNKSYAVQIIISW